MDRGPIREDRSPAHHLARRPVAANELVGLSSAGPRTPIRLRTCCREREDRCWFLGENGSIDGGMTATLASGTSGGTYTALEKTTTAAAPMWGRRKFHASSVQAFR